MNTTNYKKDEIEVIYKSKHIYCLPERVFRKNFYVDIAAFLKQVLKGNLFSRNVCGHVGRQ